jgi:superfamily II DNA/RNA helicase
MTPPSASPHSFGKFALSPATLANLERLGYLEMTAIQLASLPPALEGKDVIAQAKTGSGKTAAFALALLAKLDTRNFSVQGLVLPHPRAGRSGDHRDSPPGACGRQRQGGDPVRWRSAARPEREP